jgi:pimeloyl-ACP methyl ester carboxylesterase
LFSYLGTLSFTTVFAGKWWGDRNVQPVLGLHGWEDNANTFDNLVPLLNVSSFLAIDIMGHGLSSNFPAAGAHNFMDVVMLLRRISNYFQWTKISIIGNSFYFVSIFHVNVDEE